MTNQEELEDVDGLERIEAELEDDEIPGITISLRDRELRGDVITPELLEDVLEDNPEYRLVRATFLVTNGEDAP